MQGAVLPHQGLRLHGIAQAHAREPRRLGQGADLDGAGQKISASEFYGIWGDDGMTDEEFIETLRAERTFNQDIVEL